MQREHLMEATGKIGVAASPRALGQRRRPPALLKSSARNGRRAKSQKMLPWYEAVEDGMVAAK
eukprot:6183200-Prymnesium_polylepis.1